MVCRLVLAMLGATIAALGNAVVAVYNGYSARQLEQNKADADRVLEIVKSHDPATVSSQLIFLADVGLLKDPSIISPLRMWAFKNQISLLSEPGYSPRQRRVLEMLQQGSVASAQVELQALKADVEGELVSLQRELDELKKVQGVAN